MHTDEIVRKWANRINT